MRIMTPCLTPIENNARRDRGFSAIPLAAWPLAFEEGGKHAMTRHFPEGEYSIYVHGHSTGCAFRSEALREVMIISTKLTVRYPDRFLVKLRGAFDKVILDS